MGWRCCYWWLGSASGGGGSVLAPRGCSGLQLVYVSAGLACLLLLAAVPPRIAAASHGFVVNFHRFRNKNNREFMLIDKWLLA